MPVALAISTEKQNSDYTHLIMDKWNSQMHTSTSMINSGIGHCQ